MDVSLEHDGLIVAEPQCKCDSADCTHRDKCVIQVELDGSFFPKFVTRHADGGVEDASCHGDLTVVCRSYRGPQVERS